MVQISQVDSIYGQKEWLMRDDKERSLIVLSSEPINNTARMVLSQSKDNYEAEKISDNELQVKAWFGGSVDDSYPKGEFAQMAYENRY